MTIAAGQAPGSFPAPPQGWFDGPMHHFALRAYFDVWFDTPPKYTGARIVIGTDPPN